MLLCTSRQRWGCVGLREPTGEPVEGRLVGVIPTKTSVGGWASRKGAILLPVWLIHVSSRSCLLFVLWVCSRWVWLGEIVVLASLALLVGCSQLDTPNDRSGGCRWCSVCSSKGCSVLVCVLCTLCLLLGCQLCEFSGAVRGARYSISLLGSFSGLLDALGGGGRVYLCAVLFLLRYLAQQQAAWENRPWWW